MTNHLNIIIVERNGTLKTLTIKDFKLEEVYKKCGFKKSNDFIKQIEWNVKYNSKKYYIEVYAKSDGRSTSENKYDFPPPIDTKLFFGSCAILAHFKNENGNKCYTDLNLPLWNKMYENLFGGFEDLDTTAKEDEYEEDELENVPKENKTKHGYLKDGFVVDSSDELSGYETESYCEEESDDYGDKTNDIHIEDIGSELSEETYDYDSEDVEK